MNNLIQLRRGDGSQHLHNHSPGNNGGDTLRVPWASVGDFAGGAMTSFMDNMICITDNRAEWYGKKGVEKLLAMWDREEAERIDAMEDSGDES